MAEQRWPGETGSVWQPWSMAALCNASWCSGVGMSLRAPPTASSAAGRATSWLAPTRGTRTQSGVLRTRPHGWLAMGALILGDSKVQGHMPAHHPADPSYSHGNQAAHLLHAGCQGPHVGFRASSASRMCRALALVPGKGIVSGSHDTTLRLWNAAGTCLRVLEGHTALVYACAATAEGMMASASEDNTARLWQGDGTCLQAIPHPGELLAVPLLCCSMHCTCVRLPASGVLLLVWPALWYHSIAACSGPLPLVRGKPEFEGASNDDSRDLMAR